MPNGIRNLKLLTNLFLTVYSTYLGQICAVIALRAMSTSEARSREYSSDQYITITGVSLKGFQLGGCIDQGFLSSYGLPHQKIILL